MSKRSVQLLLEDMIEAAAKIEKYIRGLSQTDFLADERTVDAVVRNLEIIGEAANRLPTEFTETHSEIEWKKIIGLRHRIVHDYFGVDLEMVWNIVTTDIPTFYTSVRQFSV